MCIFFYEQPMSITCQSKSERKGIMPLILHPSYHFISFIYLFLNKLPSFTLACKACCGHFIFEN
jgi:hypothetical protein